MFACHFAEQNIISVSDIITAGNIICRRQTSLRERNLHANRPLCTPEFFQWAVTAPLYNTGEQVYHISPEMKSAYPEIPWTLVSGLRHRLVHDYDGINWKFDVESVN